jgi:hypothetical protein
LFYSLQIFVFRNGAPRDSRSRNPARQLKMGSLDLLDTPIASDRKKMPHSEVK